MPYELLEEAAFISTKKQQKNLKIELPEELKNRAEKYLQKLKDKKKRARKWILQLVLLSRD